MPAIEFIRLFSDSSREKQAQNYKITIDIPMVNSEGVDIAGPVTGYLTNEFQVDMDADWSTFFDSPDPGRLIGGVGIAQGKPLFASGIFTRKFYKGNSYIIFNSEFRIVDYEGTNNVVPSVRGLMKAISPYKTPGSIQGVANGIVNTGKSAAQAVQGGIEELLSSNSFLQADLISALEQGIDDFNAAGVSPVSVTVGNFFQSRMVIESVSVKYSKEQTAKGPLYADFVVRFSTPYVVPRDEVGKLMKSASGRVRIKSGN